MAYDFEEASDQYILYTPNANYTQKVAVSVWCYFESFPAGHMMQFVTKGKNNAGNDRNFSIGWHPNPRISIGWFNPAGSIHEWAHDITLSTGQWYHFYMEIDTTTNPDT